MSSLDRILPFLKPIEDLLVDPAVTEVMVNAGGRRVFVERLGCIEAVPDRTLEVRNLTVAIKNIARACGDEISERQPMLDARLEDGSRVAAMFPPCAVDGPTLTVRKFTHRYTLDDLVTVGTLTRALADSLRAAVDARHNILISGGTGTGKTTLLNAVAQTIPPEDRIVLIEETSEILIDKPNLVRFEARRAQAPLGQEEPMPAVTISDLDPRWRGAWSGGVRSSAGAQHRSPWQPDHHPCEQRGAGAHEACALCPDGERRSAASEYSRGHHPRGPPGGPSSSAGRKACCD
jgi:Flp pilus assembly CpaF family ATPase